MVWSTITQLNDIKAVLIVRLFRHLYRERNLKKSLAFEWKKFPDKSWKGIIISQGGFFAVTNVLAWISPVLIRFSWKRNVYVKKKFITFHHSNYSNCCFLLKRCGITARHRQTGTYVHNTRSSHDTINGF